MGRGLFTESRLSRESVDYTTSVGYPRRAGYRRRMRTVNRSVGYPRRVWAIARQPEQSKGGGGGEKP